MMPARFASGLVGITVGIDAAFGGRMSVITDLLDRHFSGDWGDLGPEDRTANDQALLTGERLVSAYDVADGSRVWIITEADRSASTVLLPDEY
jgi:hypothetical protein